MTVEQKAKAWDQLKEVAMEYKNKAWTSQRTRESARELFEVMCEAEVSVQKYFPHLGEKQ